MALLAKLDEEEIQFMESLHDSVCLSETLFSDVDNLSNFEVNKYAHIRLFQLAMLSYEYIIDDLPELSPKENFKLLEGAGNLYNFGSRRYGKTLVTLVLDMLISIIHLDGWETIFSSYDAVHIRSILERIIPTVENHPFFRMYNVHVKRSPTYLLRFNNGFTIHSVNQNMACFDDKTEVLTDDGWKTYNCISENHKVLSLNPKTNVADYCKISKIFKYNYNDYIYETTGNCNFVFTPEHNIFYKNRDNEVGELKKIKDFNLEAKYSICLQNNFIWNKKDSTKQLEFIVREDNKKYIKKQIDCDDWLEFLGWFVAEGHIHNNKVYITQHYNVNKKKCQLIKNVLDRIGVNYCFVAGKQFKFRCKSIAEYLKKECYNGTYIRVKTVYNSHNKKVPDYIKNLSSRQITIFLKSYGMGDGSIRRKNNSNQYTRYNTISEQLKNDIEELILKSGKSFSTLKHKNNVYSIDELSSRYRSIFLNKIQKNKYSGNVWCVETNPYHLILIKRNGKCCWTGNSKNPGGQWFGHHVKKVWIEEASFEIDAVHEKRVDAVSEVGCIERLSGMTNFTKYSPAGKIFYDLSKKPWIVNLPQYVNPFWDEKERKKAEKKYGGESSIGFRVFVKGEIVEEGVSVFDMERVRKNYLDEKLIKNFEVTKDTFNIFEERVIVEKPANADIVYIAADVGESAPTEIVIFAKIKNKYRYIYNVTLHNLTDKQQLKVFKYLGHRMEANFIGVDCTDGTGRAIQRALGEDSNFKNNLVWVSFNEKIPVDFEKDDKDNVIIKAGKPVYKEEYVAEWSVQHLKDLLYSERMEIPIDYKFDTQINSIIAMQSGNRTIYRCVAEQDHLFQAFQTFSIIEWNSEFVLNTPIQKKKHCKSGV